VTSSIPGNTSKEQLHTSPADRSSSQQLPHVTAVSPTVTQQQHRLHEPVSPPLANNSQHQLSNNSTQHRQLQPYPKQLSTVNTSPVYTHQQPVSSPPNDVGISPKQVIPDSENGPSEPFSISLANNAEHRLSQYSPQHQRLPPYPQQFSDSHSSPLYISTPQQPASSPQNVGQTSRAVRATSPKQMIPGIDAPSHSRPILDSAPMKSFTHPVEQEVYDRSALNQHHTPVYHYQQYSQPAGNYDRYRHHNPTSVSQGLDPYRQHVPLSYPVSQPKLGLQTTDVDGTHPQITASRSNSCREQPPADNYGIHRNKQPTVPPHRISPQRDMLGVRNGQSQSGERMLSFGSRPNPHQQAVQLNDPYRLHYPAVDGPNQVYQDRLGSRLLLSQRNEVNNRQRIYTAENANDSAAVRAAGIQAVHGLNPAVGRSPQYSVPAYHAQQNSEVFRYPSPAHVVKHSASAGPLPLAKHQHDDLRNPLTESQYFRGRQVCMLYGMLYS